MAIEGFAELIWTMGGAAALALIGWGGRRVAADRAIADARAMRPAPAEHADDAGFLRGLASH
jgi:hypothetical protein